MTDPTDKQAAKQELEKQRLWFAKWRLDKITNKQKRKEGKPLIADVRRQIGEERWATLVKLHCVHNLTITEITSACHVSTNDLEFRVLRYQINELVENRKPVPKDWLEKALYCWFLWLKIDPDAEQDYPAWFKIMVVRLYIKYGVKRNHIYKSLGFTSKQMAEWIADSQYREGLILPKELHAALPKPEPETEPVQINNIIVIYDDGSSQTLLNNSKDLIIEDIQQLTKAKETA